MDYVNLPAMAPPHGAQPGFVHPQTLGTSLVAFSATFPSLMLVVVAIRIYSRGSLMHAIGWDDCESEDSTAGAWKLRSYRCLSCCSRMFIPFVENIDR